MDVKILLAMVVLFITLVFSGSVMAGSSPGPAPNSGDGIPDGSGMDGSFQNGNSDGGSPGPAPNSGDGIPDRPGW